MTNITTINANFLQSYVTKLIALAHWLGLRFPTNFNSQDYSDQFSTVNGMVSGYFGDKLRFSAQEEYEEEIGSMKIIEDNLVARFGKFKRSSFFHNPFSEPIADSLFNNTVGSPFITEARVSGLSQAKIDFYLSKLPHNPDINNPATFDKLNEWIEK